MIETYLLKLLLAAMDLVVLLVLPVGPTPGTTDGLWGVLPLCALDSRIILLGFKHIDLQFKRSIKQKKKLTFKKITELRSLILTNNLIL